MSLNEDFIIIDEDGVTVTNECYGRAFYYVRHEDSPDRAVVEEFYPESFSIEMNDGAPRVIAGCKGAYYETDLLSATREEAVDSWLETYHDKYKRTAERLRAQAKYVEQHQGEPHVKFAGISEAPNGR